MAKEIIIPKNVLSFIEKAAGDIASIESRRFDCEMYNNMGA